MEFLDREVGELVAAFPTPPNVIVVSDHGFGPARHYPMFSGWHGEHGVFIAAGPDVPQWDDHLSVNYIDIVPTILRLLGFRSPSTMPGHSLVPDRSALPDAIALTVGGTGG
jgi:arylsulfatase A-like enzyme